LKLEAFHFVLRGVIQHKTHLSRRLKLQLNPDPPIYRPGCPCYGPRTW